MYSINKKNCKICNIMHLIKKVDHILFSGECKENTNIACGSKFFHNFELVGSSSN